MDRATDDWYTILVSWRPDGSLLGWYINLQEPMRRNPIGFEAMDLMLDIVLESDLSWRWKDSEFDEIVRRGTFDPNLSEQVRTTALSVIDDIEHQGQSRNLRGPEMVDAVHLRRGVDDGGRPLFGAPAVVGPCSIRGPG